MLSDGCLVNSKKVKFLDFKQKTGVAIDDNGPLLEDKKEHSQNRMPLPAVLKNHEVKEEVEVNELDKELRIKTEDEDSSNDNKDVEEVLVPSG